MLDHLRHETEKCKFTTCTRLATANKAVPPAAETAKRPSTGTPSVHLPSRSTNAPGGAPTPPASLIHMVAPPPILTVAEEAPAWRDTGRLGSAVAGTAYGCSRWLGRPSKALLRYLRFNADLHSSFTVLELSQMFNGVTVYCSCNCGASCQGRLCWLCCLDRYRAVSRAFSANLPIAPLPFLHSSHLVSYTDSVCVCDHCVCNPLTRCRANSKHPIREPIGGQIK